MSRLRINQDYTPAAGSPSEIFDFLGTPSQGDLIYRAASAWSRLAAGTADYVLTSGGPSADPVWASAAGLVSFQYVDTATVSGAAATTITMSGLDLTADNAYLVLVRADNATASNSAISLYFNGDTTATNYYRQSVVATTADAYARTNSAVFMNLVASSDCVGFAIIFNNFDGKPAAFVMSRDGDTATMGTRYGNVHWTSASNVTSISLTASVASSFAIGSSFSVFKLSVL